MPNQSNKQTNTFDLSLCKVGFEFGSRFKSILDGKIVKKG